MGSEDYCIANAIVFGVVLNIVLPMALIPFATEEEKKPPSGAASLDMKGQFMHMMVHHGQVPVMSSVIVALMVGLAVYLGYVLKPIERVVQLMK
jgi:predicted secreted protein